MLGRGLWDPRGVGLWTIIRLGLSNGLSYGLSYGLS